MPGRENPSADRLNPQLKALIEVANTLTSSRSMGDMLSAIMDTINAALEPADVGAVMIWDSSSGIFKAQAAFGYDLESLKRVGLRAGESVTGKVYDAGKAQLFSSPDQIAFAMEDMREANRNMLAKSLPMGSVPSGAIAAPIGYGEKRFGVLILESLNAELSFIPDDIPFVQTLAGMIALAIERERLAAKADYNQAIQQRNQLESELLATLSHELRMPLTAIKGYASALLLDEVEWSDEKKKEFLELIDEECDNMQVMLMELIDSSIIEENHLSIETQPIDLGEIARETAREMQIRTDSHNLMVDFPTDCPHIDADPHRIRQVLRNILENAIKYAPEGGLIIIRGEERIDDLVVHIADQGIGISPEDLITLFEKYRRIRHPETAQIPGMGLGLPIARTIIEAHGGRIWAESKLDQGTTISFSLPKTQIVN